MITGKYIAIYIRESTKEQAFNGYNLDGQEKACLKYVKEEFGNKEVRIYREEGKSAKTLNRPLLKKMMVDIEKGEIETVVIFELSRLVRRVRQWFELFDVFSDCNVNLISLRNYINTDTAMGRYQVVNQVNNYELEIDTTGERTDFGLLEGAEQGNFIKGGKSPFGYKRVEKDGRKLLEVIPEQETVLKEMRTMLLSGFAPYYISLSIRKNPYLKEHDIKFNENQVTRMLTHEIYSSIMIHKDKRYILDIKPIFTKEEIQEHKDIIATRKKTTKYSYMFERKVFTEHGNIATNKSTVKKNGAILYYYDKQTQTRVNEKKIYNEVLDYLQLTQRIYKKKRNKKYESEIKALQNKRDKIVLMYKTNKIMWETYSKELKEIEKELQIVRKSYKEYVECFHAYFNDLSRDEKMLLIAENINRIDVDFITKKVISIS